MSFHEDLYLRLANLSETYGADDDPAIWAVRACGIIAQLVGSEEWDMVKTRNAFEALYIMAPDEIIQATARLNEILKKENN